MGKRDWTSTRHHTTEESNGENDTKANTTGDQAFALLSEKARTFYRNLHHDNRDIHTETDLRCVSPSVVKLSRL